MAKKGLGKALDLVLPKGITKKIGKILSKGGKNLGKGISKGLSKSSKFLKSGWKNTLKFAKTGAKWTFKAGKSVAKLGLGAAGAAVAFLLGKNRSPNADAQNQRSQVDPEQQKIANEQAKQLTEAQKKAKKDAEQAAEINSKAAQQKTELDFQNKIGDVQADISSAHVAISSGIKAEVKKNSKTQKDFENDPLVKYYRNKYKDNSEQLALLQEIIKLLENNNELQHETNELLASKNKFDLNEIKGTLQAKAKQHQQLLQAMHTATGANADLAAAVENNELTQVQAISALATGQNAKVEDKPSTIDGLRSLATLGLLFGLFKLAKGIIGGIDSIGQLWDNTKNLIGDGFDYIGNLIGLRNEHPENESESDSGGPSTPEERVEEASEEIKTNNKIQAGIDAVGATSAAISAKNTASKSLKHDLSKKVNKISSKTASKLAQEQSAKLAKNKAISAIGARQLAGNKEFQKGIQDVAQKVAKRGAEKGLSQDAIEKQIKVSTEKYAQNYAKKHADKLAGKSALKKVAFKLAPKLAQKLERMTLVKFAAKASSKKIPLMGTIFGGYWGLKRLLNGDLTGAGLELSSGLSTDLGTMLAVPTGGTSAIAGWAGAMAIDAATAYRDYEQVKKAVEEGDLKTLRTHLEVSDIMNMIYGDGTKGDISMPSNSPLRIAFEKRYKDITSLAESKKSQLGNVLKMVAVLPDGNKYKNEFNKKYVDVDSLSNLLNPEDMADVVKDLPTTSPLFKSYTNKDVTVYGRPAVGYDSLTDWNARNITRIAQKNKSSNFAKSYNKVYDNTKIIQSRYGNRGIKYDNIDGSLKLLETPNNGFHLKDHSVVGGMWNQVKSWFAEGTHGTNDQYVKNGVTTKDQKAVVGDGFRHEIIITPDDRAYITPDVPTVVSLPKGTRVIPSVEGVENLKASTDMKRFQPKEVSHLEGMPKSYPKYAKGTGRTIKIQGKPFTFESEKEWSDAKSHFGASRFGKSTKNPVKYNEVSKYVVNNRATKHANQGRWAQCVIEMGNWYKSNINEYNQSKTYKCDMLNNQTVAVRPDCSGFVCACLRLYGAINTTYGTGSMTEGSDFAKKLQAHGFTLLKFTDWNSVRPFDILVAPNKHTEILNSVGDGNLTSYSWGRNHSFDLPCNTYTGAGYKLIYRNGALQDYKNLQGNQGNGKGANAKMRGLYLMWHLTTDPNGPHFSAEQAAGMLGNMAVETGQTYLPGLREIGTKGTNKGGVGIVQFTGDSWIGTYNKYASMNPGLRVNHINHQHDLGKLTLGEQARFLSWSMKNNPWLKGELSKKGFFNATTAESASTAFLDAYERPSAAARAKTVGMRAGFAKQWLDEWNKNTDLHSKDATFQGASQFVGVDNSAVGMRGSNIGAAGETTDTESSGDSDFSGSLFGKILFGDNTEKGTIIDAFAGQSLRESASHGISATPIRSKISNPAPLRGTKSNPKTTIESTTPTVSNSESSGQSTPVNVIRGGDTINIVRGGDNNSRSTRITPSSGRGVNAE